MGPPSDMVLPPPRWHPFARVHVHTFPRTPNTDARAVMQEVLLRFVPFARGSILIDRDFRTITKLHPLTDAVGFNVIRTVASFDGVHLTLEKTAVRELGKGLTLNVRPRNVD